MVCSFALRCLIASSVRCGLFLFVIYISVVGLIMWLLFTLRYALRWWVGECY